MTLPLKGDDDPGTHPEDVLSSVNSGSVVLVYFSVTHYDKDLHSRNWHGRDHKKFEDNRIRNTEVRDSNNEYVND